MRAPIVAAVKAGIPVLFVDTTLNDSSMAVTTISTDNLAGGKAAADALAKVLGTKGGKVAGINTVPGVSTTDARMAGFTQELKKYPQLDNLGTTFPPTTPPRPPLSSRHRGRAPGSCRRVRHERRDR